MKAVRIQIDMVYQVEDDKADEVYKRDVEFFQGIEGSFNLWAEQENEPRIPVNFDFRNHIVEVIDEEDEEQAV